MQKQKTFKMLVSSAPGQALFGAPPPLINSKPVVTTSTRSAASCTTSARYGWTSVIWRASSVFRAATYSTPNPFTSHGPGVFGAPLVSSVSTIYYRPHPAVSSGPAVFGAPPRNHTPKPVPHFWFHRKVVPRGKSDPVFPCINVLFCKILLVIFKRISYYNR